MKLRNKWAAALLTLLVLLMALPVGAAGGTLDLPTVEEGGISYYDVTSRTDLKKAVLYSADNFLEALPVCFDMKKRDWDGTYGNNVVNFLDYYTKGYFTYRGYSVNTVCADAATMENGDYGFGTMELSYLDTQQELEKADAQIQSILSGISSKSTYDKLLYIAEYICKITEAGFEQMPDGGYDAINGVCDVLNGVRTNTVCTSYVLTFQRFMEKAGIKGYILANGGIHAWNIVELDGKWYGVDCTFGDQGDTFDRTYFLMGKDTMEMYNGEGANVEPVAIFAKDHTVSAQNYGAASPTTSKTTGSSASKTTPATSAPTSKPTSRPAFSGSAATASDAASSALTESQTTGSALNSQPEPSSETDALTMDVSQEPTVGRDVFEQARKEGQALELKGESYTWTFSKETLAGLTELPDSFNTEILFDADMNDADRETLQSLAGEAPCFGFRFAYHGALPGKAAVTLALGTDFAGKTVTIYSVSDSGKATAEAQGMVSADGQLVFETDHCSLWFVTPADTPVQAPAGAGWWIWLIVLAVVLLVAAAAVFCWWYFIRRKQKGQDPAQTA